MPQTAAKGIMRIDVIGNQFDNEAIASSERNGRMMDSEEIPS
jgi:hypothetical protein